MSHDADAAPPRGLLDSLAASRSAARRVLVLRHSDRFEIATGSGRDVDLTKLGERRARALGRLLGEQPRWGLTSPLLRCRRTAEAAGFSARPSDLLGAPGPFVVDRVVGGQVFSRHGAAAVVRAQLRGETWGCMRPLADGSAMLLAELRRELAAREGTGLAVSHDAIVMPFVSWITGEDFRDSWLDPLDGAVLTARELFWRGASYVVPR